MLRTKPELKESYAAIDGFWSRLNERTRGWRTIILARLVQLGWSVIALHDAVIPYLAGVDWTPISARVLAFIPPDLRTLALSLFGVLCGAVVEWFRRITTGPANRRAGIMAILTTILSWLGSLLGGPFAKSAVDAYKAKLDAASSQDARAADLASKAIDAEIEGRREAAKIRAAEGAWGPTGLILFGFGLITLSYYGKIVVWDVMLGWGTTDAIRGAVGEWMNTIIISLFGSGTVTALTRMALTRFGR